MRTASTPLRRILLVALPAVALYVAFTVWSVSADPATVAAQEASPGTSAAPVVTPAPVGSPVPFATPEPSASTIPAPPVPARIVHPGDGSTNTCYDCHLKVNPEQQRIAQQWETSIHGKGGIGCADCHGGDPTSDQVTVAMGEQAGFIGTPSRERTVGLCASCHADPERMKAYQLPTDQYAKYYTSVHGQRLLSSNDTRVAICVDCHGVHDVKKASDPTANVYPLNVPKLCASCHSDPDLMKSYGIPTDQFAIYETSVHGKKLLGELDVRAPSCASCHGSHDAKPPRSTEVVEVCGRCHTKTQELYEESRHSQLSTAAPKCWTCHGTHDVSQPSSELFFHPEQPDYQCDTCHDPATKSVRIELDRFLKNPEDRRCDTCHHPNSVIYSQVEGIAAALRNAQSASDEAAAKIDDASRLGMLVEDAQVGLSGAKTSLIQAQAAVHTTKLTTIAGLSDESIAKAGEAAALAQGKIDESDFRRQAMVVVLGFIVLNVLGLYVIKRRLDRELEAR
jgi:hypothetical protein